MTLCSKVAFGDRSKSLSLATPDSDGGRDMESAHFPSIITTFLTEPSLKPTKTPWDPWAAAHKQRGTPKKRVLLDGWMTSTESTSGSFRLQKDTEPSQLLLIIISPDKDQSSDRSAVSTAGTAAVDEADVRMGSIPPGAWELAFPSMQSAPQVPCDQQFSTLIEVK